MELVDKMNLRTLICFGLEKDFDTTARIVFSDMNSGKYKSIPHKEKLKFVQEQHKEILRTVQEIDRSDDRTDNIHEKVIQQILDEFKMKDNEGYKEQLNFVTSKLN